MKTTRTPKASALPVGVELEMIRALGGAPVPHDLDREGARVMRLLDTGPRHPVLVGPSEVGKTTVAWAVARAIANGARPAGAKAMWHVSLLSLEDSCGKDSSVGERLAAILDEAALSPAKPIVFVSDLHALRASDAQHAFVKALRHSGARVLGEATPTYLAWCADDAELASVSHIVRIDEPDSARTAKILREHARTLSRNLGVAVDDEALTRVMRHAERLMPLRRFPGKAIGLLDEAAREAVARGERRVSAARVTDRVCESLRLPRVLVDPETRFDPSAFREQLQRRIVGHGDAIGAIAQSLALYKAEVGDERRPIGVLLLAGPAGVGKTLVAEEVAASVFGNPSRLVRVSLAEHSEDWKVDQLFGVRSSQSVETRRGIVARQLAGKPFSVLLFDEIEKAHPLFFKHVLRALEQGKYVNGNDEEVSLLNTLVIMTTSLGADVFREAGLGFTGIRRPEPQIESARKRVADQLPSELLDRVDRVCICPPLEGDALVELVRREIELGLARAGVAGRGIAVRIDADVATVIAEQAIAGGTHSGARALRRRVERAVFTPLALRLLERDPKPGSYIRIAASALAEDGSESTPHGSPAREVSVSIVQAVQDGELKVAPVREDRAAARRRSRPATGRA